MPRPTLPVLVYSISVVHFVFKSTFACTKLMRNVVRCTKINSKWLVLTKFIRRVKNSFHFSNLILDSKLQLTKMRICLFSLTTREVKTTISINFDRRDNYLSVEATILRVPDKEYIHRFEDINHFPNEIMRSANKVKSMCSRFLE